LAQRLTENKSSLRQKLRTWLARLGGLHLQRTLVIGFVLTTAITILIATPITLAIIDHYLTGARDERLDRDMRQAEVLYDQKTQDIASIAQRLSSAPTIASRLKDASGGDSAALQAIDGELENELSALGPDTHRFIVALDGQGRALAGRVASNSGRRALWWPNTNWGQLDIVSAALDEGRGLAGTEIFPAHVLDWFGLVPQASIRLVDTPNANPVPYDAREGTAGLVLAGVWPVHSAEGQVIGAILVGHLFNNDFTLVDRIREVAGVDTATIFLGDLRVSTNVVDEAGRRAVGTRVSQEVFERVLLKGQEFTGRALVLDEPYVARYTPLRDYRGQTVGSLYVGARESSFVQLVQSFRRWLWLIAAASIGLTILIAIPLARSISRPLTEMAEATRVVASGDWSVRVPVYGPGEMGILAGSFNTMVKTLSDTQERLVQRENLASLGQLAAGVAHEINNPLGSVLLYADLLREEIAPDGQPQQDLHLIVQEVTRCKTIVANLLNFAHQHEVVAHEIDLNALLNGLVQEAGRKEQFSGIRLKSELDPALPPIEADPLQLRQVMLNLMNNATEAMPQGGDLVIRTRSGSNAEIVLVEVQDSGCGISEENMKKLFTPFFTTKPTGRGTGLGLAISYGIVRMHQGQITVTSQIGKGTTFKVTLPRKLAPAGRNSRPPEVELVQGEARWKREAKSRLES
jgi:two-component system NtrC family sensor kinase